MARQRISRASAGSAAVFVRVVAFLVASFGVVAIPATLFAATIGHVSAQAAAVTLALAVGLIATAMLATRRVDPLRS